MEIKEHINQFDTLYAKFGQHWMDDVKDKWIRQSYLMRNVCIAAMVDAVSPHTIVDIGCGTGDLTIMLDNNDRYIVGIEPSTINMRKFLQNTKLQCYKAHAEQLPLKDNSFDLAIMADVIEHVFDAYASIKEAMRVLANGGYLIITTPNKYSEWFWSLFNTRNFRKLKVKDSLYTPRQLKNLISKVGGAQIVMYQLNTFYPRSAIISKIFSVDCKLSWKIFSLCGKIKVLNYRQLVLIKKVRHD